MNINEFIQATSYRASLNLTGNVAAIAASMDGPKLSLTYYLFGPETEKDEEYREQFAVELLGDFPELCEASNKAEIVIGDVLSGRDDLVFRRI